MRIEDWLVPMLEEFARQKRRALRGSRSFRDSHVHVDGWPEVSVAAFAREGGITGGGGPRGQRFEEVYKGHGLTVWRCYTECPLEVREMIFAHYIASGSAPQKAKELGIALSMYWQRLKHAYYYLAGWIDRDGRQALKSEGETRADRAHGRKCVKNDKND